MKISAIHTYEAGPLGTQKFDFKDEWSGEIASHILFRGPNGCGKSSILRVIASLWNAFGGWLHNRKVLPKNNAERERLQHFGGVALFLEDLPFNGPPLVLAFGDSRILDDLDNEHLIPVKQLIQ